MSDRPDLPENPDNSGRQSSENRPMAERRRPSTRRPRKKKKKKMGFSLGRLIFWIIFVIALGGGGYWYWTTSQAIEASVGFDVFVSGNDVGQTRMGDRSVVLVFPQWDATGYVTEERQISSRDRAGEDLLSLMQQLCQGPAISGSVSPIPEGCVANAAFINPEDKAVVLDFSQELVTGHPGGSAAEAATLTSILRTVALNFPETRRCVILVDGAQVETLAGHLNLDRPFDPRRWL
ncbi:MAG: GerMN domain-containing protein [bacterium]|nr:GerMN domain-containing protein [bacterium]